MTDRTVTEYAAVVLTGGRGSRLGGVDKATLQYADRPLLDLALAAVDGASSVIVVGPPTTTSRAVRFVREQPAGAGPAAGLLAGRDALPGSGAGGPTRLVVLAVDMPRVSSATVARLLRAMAGHDGAFLVDGAGRRQLAGVLTLAALDAQRPPAAEIPGLPVHRLLERMDLVDVPAQGGEAHDVDTWADLAEPLALAGERGLHKSGAVNLHDWIDELCDVLDLETEVDEGLILDLARSAAHNVARPAAPLTTYLLGFAAGSRGADLSTVEQLAARAQALADGWDRPAGAPDPDDVDDEVPDDSGIDHSGESFED